MSKSVFYKRDSKHLYGFSLALVFSFIYAVCFGMLTNPLHQYLSLGGAIASSVVHILIISIIGTAICCLFFLLPNKKLVVLAYRYIIAFAFLILILGLVYMEGENRLAATQMILLFVIGPTLIGNLSAIVLYRHLTKNQISAE